MLKSLSISNYALIDKLEIDFESGFSVITGETGAGKSIILGALSLVLGQRCDVSSLKNKERKSVIEAEFNVLNYGFERLFEEEDVDFVEDTIIRREILTSGKSRAFVNDTPVTLSFLKKISTRLIDIHSQHQNLMLGDTGFQLSVVDTVAQNEKEKLAYNDCYLVYKSLLKEKKALEASNSKLKDDVDYMQFQYSQLEEMKLKEGEQDELERENELLAHAEEVKGNLFAVVERFKGEESSIVSALKDSIKNIEKIVAFLPEGENWIQRLETAYIDLEDLSSDLDGRMESIEYDPDRFQLVNSRLDQIFTLQKKHKVSTVEELIQIQKELKEQLTRISCFDEDLNEIQKQIEVAEGSLKLAAAALTKSRKKVVGGIQKTLVGQLNELGMPNASLVVSCTPLSDYDENGLDEIEFLFSANKNGELAPVTKVASGGEMSRVMLCIKSLLSVSKGLPTIIFDEIDTGVSGEVAAKMGKIMQEIAENIQVLSITHLPQIAVLGKSHYKVFKVDGKTETNTNIEKLELDSRVIEIAKMLSGSNLSDAALINAKELLGVL